MAERPSAKREHPEGGNSSEAEAKPSRSIRTPMSKRCRREEDNEGSPAADSTTAVIHDKEMVPAQNARCLISSGSEVDHVSSPGVSGELTPAGEDNGNPSSTSGNNLPSENRTESCLEDCQPSVSSNSQSSNSQHINSGSINCVPSEALVSGAGDGSKKESTEEGPAEQIVATTCTRESSESQTGCNKSSDSQTAAEDLKDQPEQTLPTDLAVTTSAVPDETSSPDGQGSAIPEGTSTQKEPLRGLKETDVGIVEYISKHKGFHGVIKQRYQDFLVNEVDIDGKIVRLMDMTSPDAPEKVSIDIDDVLSSHDKQHLQELVTATDKSASHCIEVQDLDKDQRKKIHEVIRQDFTSLESSTLDGDGKKVIKVTKVTRGGRKQRSNWNKSRPNFCRFVMHKENMEVNDALSLISKYSHVKHNSFGFSGTKDKRAVTVQEVTVYRVEAERLSRLNSILRGIRLGNFRYVKEQLSLGDHSGNHFVIVLRDVDGSQEDIDHALTSMRDVGFINYFGMQRFGNSQVATHLVGKAVLHSDWKESVDLILKPREGNTQDNQWRQLWMDTRDPKAVMDVLPKHKTISVEMQLLKGLMESQNNYFKGIQCIPRNVRLLYVHSYQSYIWNSIVTRRIQKYGLKVIPGDLVLKESIPGSDGEQPQTSVVDAAGLDSYHIQDVVFPLPGYSVQYPQNDVGDWYRELLEKDGLDIRRMRHPVNDYSLSGKYRKVVVKPDNVSWSVVPYSDTTIPLVLSDLDRMNGKGLPDVESDGNLRALRLEFTLSSSCYATMAIREVLKIDTSAAHQSGLNLIKPTPTEKKKNSSPNLAEV